MLVALFISKINLQTAQNGRQNFFSHSFWFDSNIHFVAIS